MNYCSAIDSTSNSATPAFVIAVRDLNVLNDIAEGYPRPIALSWINRVTDQKLKRQTVELIMRTLHQPANFCESVLKLHSVAGVRVSFPSETDRRTFAAAFRAAQRRQR